MRKRIFPRILTENLKRIFPRILTENLGEDLTDFFPRILTENLGEDLTDFFHKIFSVLVVSYYKLLMMSTNTLKTSAIRKHSNNTKRVFRLFFNAFHEPHGLI